LSRVECEFEAQAAVRADGAWQLRLAKRDLEQAICWLEEEMGDRDE